MDTNLPDQMPNVAPPHASLGSERSAEVKRIRPALLVLQGIIAIAIVFGAGVVMQSMLSDKAPPNQRPVREQVFTVQTAIASPENHQPRISLFGNIVAGNILDLRTELGGPLTYVNPEVRSGAVVAAGTILAKIDPFDFEITLEETQSDLQDANAKLSEAEARIAAETSALANARSQLELAERDLERAEELVTRGSVTRQTLDQRQQALLQRKASADAAEATLRIEETKLLQQQTQIERLSLQQRRAERDLSRTSLIAPVNAVVETEAITPGQIVTANQSVVQLLDLSAFEVKFTLSDDQYGRLTSQAGALLGSELDVIWKTGQRQDKYTALIDRTAPQISTDLGGVTLFARLANLPETTDLRPGAFVEISLPDRVYENAIRLPEAAVYDEQRIYLIQDGRLKSIPVEVLTYTGNDVLLRADIATDTKVLATRIAEVGEGLRVRDSKEPPQTGPGDRRQNSNERSEQKRDGTAETAENRRPKS